MPAPTLQLTPRDLEVLTMVYDFSGVMIRHMVRRFFPTRAGQTACYRRVGLLVEAGYLKSLRLPSTKGVGSGPLFLGLGPAGCAVVRRALGLEPRELGGTGRDMESPLFIRHHAAVCDTRLSLVLACGQPQQVELLEWIAEREWKRDPLRLRDPKTGTMMPLVPDGSLTLCLSDGRMQEAYLEQDMATIAPRRMRSKVRLYLAERRLVGRLPIVLIVTTTELRQERIARWIKDEATWLRESKGISADATRFFLTTTARLDEHTVLSAPIWQVVDGPERFCLAPANSEYEAIGEQTSVTSINVSVPEDRVDARRVG